VWLHKYCLENFLQRVGFSFSDVAKKKTPRLSGTPLKKRGSWMAQIFMIHFFFQTSPFYQEESSIFHLPPEPSGFHPKFPIQK
jgi:hypothetical protein